MISLVYFLICSKFMKRKEIAGLIVGKVDIYHKYPTVLPGLIVFAITEDRDENRHKREERLFCNAEGKLSLILPFKTWFRVLAALV